MADSRPMRHELWQLRQFQSLPFEVKVLKSKQRIREWVEFFGLHHVYVSFSGGKDSTVLLHMVRELYPEAVAVFSDTGLEFPEIRDFVKTIDNVTWVKPELTFRQVIEKCGYPAVSKEQAEWISRIRKGTKSLNQYNKAMNGVMPDGRPTRFKISEQWKFMLDAPFEIGSGCCYWMKKAPLKKYQKETDRRPILGTMACESMLRQQQWLKSGCNAFDNKKQVSAPLSFWLEEDIWEYLKEFNVPYSKIYDMGYQRTGCIFCMFGAHLDAIPTRFQRLQKTHPKLWRYCMKPWEEGGLGMREVLEYIGIPYESFMQ